METKGRVEESRLFELREAQIRAELSMDYDDPLYIDPKTIPEGMEYFWVRDTVLGDPTLSQIATKKKRGWTPVPADRHPELITSEVAWRTDNLKGYITRRGLILFQRPAEYGEVARQMQQEASMKLLNQAPGNDTLMGDPSMPGKVYINQGTILRTFKND